MNTGRPKQPPFPAGTKFHVLPPKDGSYGIKITKPWAASYTLRGFGTKAEAEEWIKQRLKETGDAEGD